LYHSSYGDTFMVTYKIIQDIDTCIGCGACAVITTDKWEMTDEGKAKLLNSEKIKETYEKTFDDSDLEEYREAVDSCPVEALKIVDKETGEKIE
jgi:ferredoxin